MVVLLGIALLVAAPAAGQQHPATPDTTEHAADPRDRTICKRFVETGSLVRGYRVCKTKAEWDRERDNLRTPATTGSSCTPGSGTPGC